MGSEVDWAACVMDGAVGRGGGAEIGLVVGRKAEDARASDRFDHFFADWASLLSPLPIDPVPDSGVREHETRSPNRQVKGLIRPCSLARGAAWGRTGRLNWK